MDERWRIELFGGLCARRGQRTITQFRTQKAAALLAYLAYFHRNTHPREVLIDKLWPECSLEAGRSRLSVELHSLRRQLEPPGVPAGAIIIADRSAVGLNATAVSIDVAEFEKALRAAKSAGAAERARLLADAVELYHGELLPGYYDDWVLTERQPLQESFFHALRQLLGHLERAGEIGQALHYAQRGVAIDPLREEVHRDVMRLYAALDQPDAALRQYRELERLLQQDDAVPSAATRDMARRIELRLAHPTGTALPPSPAPSPPARRRSQPSLPSGNVTFLLADWVDEGTAECRKSLLREFRRHGGIEVKGASDSVTVAFASARGALACAIAGQSVLVSERAGPKQTAPSVRMALCTGDAKYAADATGAAVYEGSVLHSASAMLRAAHGGQIICSESTALLLRHPAPEPGIRLIDLGVYHLRDTLHQVALAERLFQVEYPAMRHRAFPPLQATPAHTGSLPLQTTRFFGRETEIARLREMLAPVHGEAAAGGASASRLLNLTGAGGSGKTRLALEVARRLAHDLAEPWRGAIWFVPLADLSDPHLILGAVLDALRLAPAPDAAPLEQVVEALTRQPSLLVFDNFEHLMEGAALVQTLLERVPRLSCLVTSRHRLGLAGEREFVVLPLAVPTSPDAPERLLRWESVQLFVDRAQAARADFQVTPANAPMIAQLCARLEGIPLALELVAARAGVLTPAQMLARLEHRFAAEHLDVFESRQRQMARRHRTLRATIDWSYQILDPELQRFFAQLAVFRGGWMLAAAEAVAPSAGEAMALDYLTQLRECSLILVEENAEEMRFRALETLREYAEEKLHDLGDDEENVRRRHAVYFLDLAQDCTGHLRTPDEAQALRTLEVEADNVRAALDWAAHEDEHETHAALALALGRFLQRRGFPGEAMRHIRGGLRATRQGRLKAMPLYAELWHERAGLHLDQLEWHRARRCAQGALALFLRLHDLKGQAGAHNVLGLAALGATDFAAARRYFQLALAQFEHAGDAIGLGIARNNLGLVEYEDEGGDRAAAARHLQEALRLRQEQGDRRGIAETLINLGALAQKQAYLTDAWRYYAEALECEQALRHVLGVARALSNLGEVAALQNEPRRAVRFFIAAEHLFDETGSPYKSYVARLCSEAAENLGDAAPDRQALRQSLRDKSLDDLITWALSVE